MKAAEWKRLSSPVLGDGWRYAGRVAYLVPVGWVLHCILAENSGLTKGAYLLTVRVPLYVPDDVWALTWSDRWGGGAKTYEVDDQETLQAVAEMAVVVRRAWVKDEIVLEHRGSPDDPWVNEARGYGKLLIGDIDGAVKCLDDVGSFDEDRIWVDVIKERAARIRDLVTSGKIPEALEQLASWREQTMAALRVSPEAP